MVSTLLRLTRADHVPSFDGQASSVADSGHLFETGAFI